MKERDLFLFVYDELRNLARARLAKLPAGNTLQPTALVHEVFMRLKPSEGGAWDQKEYVFAAAAEAMRQILVEQARRKSALKHGGERSRVDAELEDLEGLLNVPSEVVLVVDEALAGLSEEDPELARIVELRFFVGLPMAEISAALNIPERTLHRRWRFAAAHLRRALSSRELDEYALP